MDGDAPPQVPGVRFLPNAITVLALCSGLSAVAFALNQQWLFAVGAIAAAGVLDSLDGPAARLLNSTSRIGAELDSLSDSISFGVAPALVTYIWLLRDEGRAYGWVVCLLFAVCAALRLARFNSLLDDEPKPWAKGFFTGVPAPAGGLLSQVPLLLYLRFGDGFWNQPIPVALWVVLVGVLMVSRLPSIALKSVRVAPGAIVPLLLMLLVGVGFLVIEPEIVAVAGLLVYLLHLPYAGWKFQHLRRHPELWPQPKSRRHRRSSRVRLRMPRRRRVAGRLPDGSVQLRLTPRTPRPPRPRPNGRDSRPGDGDGR